MANPNHPTRAETPMAFIRAMVNAYAQRGMDPSAALRKALFRILDIVAPCLDAAGRIAFGDGHDLRLVRRKRVLIHHEPVMRAVRPAERLALFLDDRAAVVGVDGNGGGEHVRRRDQLAQLGLCHQSCHKPLALFQDDLVQPLQR